MGLECFGSNYIGILGNCSDTAPESGLYINKLPGVSLCSASMVSDEEFQTGVELLKSLEEEAIRMTCEDFLSKLEKYYNYNYATGISTVGRHYDTFSANSFIGEMGYEYEFTSYDPLQNLFLEYFEFNSDAQYTDVAYRIIDGACVTTGTTNLDCGVNRVQLNYTAKSRKISIVLSVSGIATLADYSYNSLYSSCGCENECGCNGYECFRVRNIQKLDTETTFSYVGNAAGLVMGVQCRCDESKFICQYKSKLASAIRYKMAALLMDEIIYSKRSNPLVRNGEKSARELRADILGLENEFTGFKGGALYWKALSRAVEHAKSSIGKMRSECLSCTKTKLVTSIP